MTKPVRHELWRLVRLFVIVVALAPLLLFLSACSAPPDPERVEELFHDCIRYERFQMVFSPTDECHHYAVEQAKRKANQ